jgi:hypothetical protein
MADTVQTGKAKRNSFRKSHYGRYNMPDKLLKKTDSDNKRGKGFNQYPDKELKTLSGY